MSYTLCAHCFYKTDTQTCSQFYRATVQAVLLFISETWNLTPNPFGFKTAGGVPRTLCLEDKHRQRAPKGARQCPSVEAALKEATLKSVAEYIKSGGTLSLCGL